MKRKHVNEKTLELNVVAEILDHLRNRLGMRKSYFRGLTQQEERDEGADCFWTLPPEWRIMAFQFKAPASDPAPPYKFQLQREQHQALYQLAACRPHSVFYVFPFFNEIQTLENTLPQLLDDTWFLRAGDVLPQSFSQQEPSRTIRCWRGHATINPEYSLQRLWEGELLNRDSGVPADRFADWYEKFRRAGWASPGAEDQTQGPHAAKRRSSWLARGLRIAVVEPPEG